MSLRRALNESVVVVTGASSGIGAATALALAGRGASVVLAARSKDALAEIAARCTEAGVQVLAVPTDVTDADAVMELAAAAGERFGRIDAWVNNAGVGLYARLVDAPLDEVHRVMDVNLFGCLHGVRAAVPWVQAAGGGVIVNVASVLGAVTVPYMGPYNIAKHAVRGLSDTLRQELDDPSVSVCTVLPSSIDTPFYRNAANRTGRAPRPIPPVYPPEVVARTILRVLRRPRREAYAGQLGHLLAAQWRLMPGPAERILAGYGRRAPFTGSRAAPTAGNLFTPRDERVSVDGGFGGRTRTAVRTAAGVGLTGAAVALAVAAWARTGR